MNFNTSIDNEGYVILALSFYQGYSFVVSSKDFKVYKNYLGNYDFAGHVTRLNTAQLKDQADEYIRRLKSK